MGLFSEIIGHCNGPKSNIFNALTSAKGPGAKIPLCTIEPNTGSLPRLGARPDIVAKIISSEKIVPTQIRAEI